MNINARNLAASLAYLGADVESALLDVSSASPILDKKVRRSLFLDNELPKLRLIADRNQRMLHFIHIPCPRTACVMHAVDYICQVIDDATIVTYLQSRFSDYNIEVLLEHSANAG